MYVYDGCAAEKDPRSTVGEGRGGELGRELHSLLPREKLYNAEGSDLRAKRQKRVRLEASHSSSFRFVPAISWQLDKTVTFTLHTSTHAQLARARGHAVLARTVDPTPFFLQRLAPQCLHFD